MVQQIDTQVLWERLILSSINPTEKQKININLYTYIHDMYIYIYIYTHDINFDFKAYTERKGPSRAPGKDSYWPTCCVAEKKEFRVQLCILQIVSDQPEGLRRWIPRYQHQDKEQIH